MDTTQNRIIQGFEPIAQDQGLGLVRSQARYVGVMIILLVGLGAKFAGRRCRCRLGDQAHPSKPSAAILASYFPATSDPKTRVVLTSSHPSGFRTTIQAS